MQVEVATRLDLESDLRAAIEREAVEVAYQPIVDLRNGRIAGVEALARWRHPLRGEVPPSVFIPTAEESGLIFPLGRLVLRRACLDLARLRRSTPAARRLRVSVNVSPRQLVDAGIVEEVREALREAGLPASALVIEVTEGLMFEGGPDTNRVLETLRADGCRVSLDDFGTGFSSLGNLRSLPIDELKIDRSFVSATPEGTVNAVIAEAVVRLGAALEVAVVAEGIEDEATAARLAALGCPFGQGYHFGRPTSLEALEASLAAPSDSLGAA
jgi:EAL domain-containing protein (putative c-di-GMP-specific phosphodiesterase class I)